MVTVDKPPVLSRTTIEERAQRLLRWFDPRLLEEPQPTPVAGILARLQEVGQLKVRLQQDLGFTTRGTKILGAYDLQERTILVDRTLDPNGPRIRFTIAHELGHFVLHRDLLLDRTGLDLPDAVIQDDRSAVFGRRRALSTDRDWLEWQANTFASSLLLPEPTMRHAVVEKQKDLGILRSLGRMYVDWQPANLSDYYQMADHLKFVFQVSRRSLQIRLSDLGILRDVRDEPWARQQANWRQPALGFRTKGVRYCQN